MKTSLDNVIKKNAGTFDDHIPPMGHFERFNERLERREKKRTLHNRRWVIATSVAAMLAIVLMLQYTSPVPPTLSTQPEAIAEIVNFYNMRMTDEIDRLEKQLASLDETSRQDLLSDLEKMKKDTGSFSKQSAGINEEAYIAAIITHYNAQLESLEHIRTILEETQEETYKS